MNSNQQEKTGMSENDKTRDEINQAFNVRIAGETDPDTVAQLEIVREYLTNPKFRKALEDVTYAINR